MTVDGGTGEVLHDYDTGAEPGGRMPVRCRNRRESACPSCARQHAGDTYHLVRSGLSGGHGTTSAVAGHPRLMVTLTAPSFGAVHRASVEGRPCRPRRVGGVCDHGVPVGCGLVHAEDDRAVGRPLCPACYDYNGHVLWHACAGELWSRWVRAVRRRLATECGVTQSALGRHLRVSFAKVAEYQKRGAVHFHAVVRLDGSDGPGDPPPPWATAEVLEVAVRAAAASVEVRTPYVPAVGEYVLRWGREIEVHAIRSERFDRELSDDAVAAYVAKYVSKSVTGGRDERMRSAEEIRCADVPDHLRALMMTCWRLGGLRELEGLRLRDWAHALGFRGHVLTKSRRYSTTYGALREERSAHMRADAGHVEQPGTVTVSAWRFVGVGHSPGRAAVARWIAAEAVRQRNSTWCDVPGWGARDG